MNKYLIFLALTLGTAVTGLAQTSVAISYPSPGASLRGTVTLSASVHGSVHSVDYWVAGHSVVPGSLPVAAPYSAPWDTTTIWDGPIQIVAVGRDSGGNIVGTSSPVDVTITNLNRTTVRLTAPSLSGNLSGQVTFQTFASDSRTIQAFVYSLDGQATNHPCLCGASFTDSFSLDTRTLSNGAHILSVQIVPANSGDGVAHLGEAQLVKTFSVKNPKGVVELRSGNRYLYFHQGQTSPVQLTPQYFYNDGSSQNTNATFSSDNSQVATVSGSGVVTPGPQAGIANITVSSGGYSTTVLATNMPSAGGFPHFTKGGQIVYTYQPGQSLFVRTLFDTNAQLFYTYNQSPHITAAGFANSLHQAGMNTVNSNLFVNPIDAGLTSSLSQWESAILSREQSWLDAAKSNSFSIVGTGDDVQRTACEMNFMLNIHDNTCGTSFPNTTWQQQALNDTFSMFAKSGNVVSIEEQDETGGAVTANFRSIQNMLNIARSGTRTPPISWPTAGLQGPSAFATWMGDPTMSDYASMYWTYANTFRPEFSWGASLRESKLQLDTTVQTKLPLMQMAKPKYLLVQVTGPGYYKHVAGDRYHPGQDEITIAGTQNEAVTSEILYAAAMGFAGVRAYGYDGAAPSLYDNVIDSLWAYRRSADPASAGQSSFEQTGASPYSDLQDVKDRWQSLTNAYTLIQNLESYFVSPQLHAIDLGSCIVTGARQLSANNGRLFMALNMCDNTGSVTANLSQYQYPGAAGTRYHVAGLLNTSEASPTAASQTLSLAPGEAVVWVFHP